MRVETLLITPDLAENMLIGNDNNRKIRVKWVTALADLMRNGEFKHTHQGLCISKNGRVLDGQHRLKAIVLSGVSCLMQVSYVDDDSVFDAIDTGAKRSLTDSTGIDKRVAGMYSQAYNIFSKVRVTPRRANNLEKTLFGKLCHDLINNTGGNRRFYTSSHARLAVITAMLSGQNVDFVMKMYHNLVTLNFADMTPSAYALIRSVDNRIVDQGSKTDSFCFVYKAFSSDPNIKVLKITEKQKYNILALSAKLLSRYIEEVRL